MKLVLRFKGGKGSGDHGHAGRPGKQGGSAGGKGGPHGDAMIAVNHAFDNFRKTYSSAEMSGDIDRGITFSYSAGRSHIRQTISSSALKSGEFPLVSGTKTEVLRDGKTVGSWEGLRKIPLLVFTRFSRGEVDIKWDSSEKYGEYKLTVVPKG